MEALIWKTEQRRINDLVPREINPRKIRQQELDKLRAMIEKYNVVQIPVIDFDGKLLTWHQRLKVMQLLGRGEEITDVRVPNRPLTETETKELMLADNVHNGEFDAALLAEHFTDISLLKFNIELPQVTLPDLRPQLEKPKTTQLKPFTQTHVLLSFPPDRLTEIEDLLSQLKAKDFVEYEQGSN